MGYFKLSLNKDIIVCAFNMARVSRLPEDEGEGYRVTLTTTDGIRVSVLETPSYTEALNLLGECEDVLVNGGVLDLAEPFYLA